jgi:hypothetical protein
MKFKPSTFAGAGLSRRLGLGAAILLGVAAVAAIASYSGVFGSRSLQGYVPPEVAAPRLTPDQYRAIIADVFGPQTDLGGRFEPGMRVNGLLTVGASSVSVTAAGMEQYDKMADAIAEQVVMDETNREAMLSCKPAAVTAPDDACAAQFLGAAGEYLYRRPLADEELQEFVAAANIAATTLGDFYGGLAMSLSAMLSSPQFLFRIPSLEPDPDRRGGYRLDAWSRASRLSFFLWNAAPDRHLLDAAANGELDTPRGLAKQVDRMMASPRLEHGVRAFFSDMFHFDSFETLSKDVTIFPKFSRREMADAQEQTLRTLVDLLLVNNGDYRDVFTTKATFLTPSLAAIYKVPLPHDGPNGGVEKWERFEFPADDPRAGILSHASFTALHSPAGRSSPTDRGKALREIMMCQAVPAPPPDVMFTVLQDTNNPEHRTVRDRLLAHSTVPSCAGCHKIMDPMGLALENFDGSGEFRTVENGVPIDTSGELDGVSFTDPLGLGEAVRNNPAIPSCLVQKLTAYAFGQPPTMGQQALVRELQGHFAGHGHRLPELMRRIALSPEFYQAAEPALTLAAAN